jgi:hypothetical protein
VSRLDSENMALRAEAQKSGERASTLGSQLEANSKEYVTQKDRLLSQYKHISNEMTRYKDSEAKLTA